MGAVPHRANQETDANAFAEHSTELELSPFALLGATTRDNLQRIVELAEEKSLASNAEACERARAELTHPKNRITAEIAWLPGLSPRHACDGIAVLRIDPSLLLRPGNDRPLARANLVSSALTLLPTDISVAKWVDWICRLADLSELINPDEVLREVNEDRSISRFPEITSLELVEAELSNRQRVFREAITKTLDRLPTLKMIEVITAAVDTATSVGQIHGPSLIHDVVDTYELNTANFLRQEAETVGALIAATRANAQKGSGPTQVYVSSTEKLVRHWHRIARPIQASKKSRGLQHDPSFQMARDLRSLAVDLVNDHGMLAVAEGLLNSLKDVFAELPEFVHKLQEDEQALGRVAETRDEFEQWKKDIAFSCEIGTIFKNKLSISADGVCWRNDTYPLASVSRIRWGGTRHSINGIPTGTTYSIHFGDKQRISSLQTNEWVFKQFTDKLWKAVGVRLAVELVEGLKRGDRYQFGGATITDTGVEMTRQRFFSSSERVVAKWSDVRIWNAAGCFVLGLENDKRVQAALSYQNIDNVHVLETTVRFFFKKGGDRLSHAFREGS
jgi:hypothetical protein